MKSNFWKKVVTGVTVLSSLTLLAACGGKKDSASNSGSAAKTEDAKGAMTIWTTSNALKQSAETWGKDNKQEVKVSVVPYADFQTKLRQQIKDPTTAPDVFIVARDFVKEWTGRTGIALDLSKEFPDDIKKYKEDTYKDVVNFGSNDKGDVVTVSGEYPVGSTFYNRDVAKEVLGTDDPVKVAESMNTFEKWSDVNKKIQAKYGDKTKLLATMADALNMFYVMRQEPFVKDDTFTVTKEMADWFDKTKVMYDEKMFVAAEEGEAAQASLNTNGSFMWILPSWGFSSKIRPQIQDKAGAGKWGITAPLSPYARGGSFFFITNSSKHKKAAWEYIKSQTVDTESLVKDQKSKVGYPSSKKAAEELVKSGYAEPLLGNQKVYDYYAEQAKVQEKETKDVVTKYDGSIQKIMGDILQDFGAGNISKEDGLKEIGKQVKNAYPELTVKEAY